MPLRLFLNSLLLVALNCFFCQLEGCAEDGYMSRVESLDDGASVLVETLDAATQRYGVTREKIKTLIELKLLQNGIKVYPSGAKHPVLTPSVYVQITAFDDDGAGLYFSLHTAIKAMVMTTKDVYKLPQIDPQVLAEQSFLGEAWHDTSLHHLGRNFLPGELYDSIGSNVDSLMRDYLLSKQSKAPQKVTSQKK